MRCLGLRVQNIIGTGLNDGSRGRQARETFVDKCLRRAPLRKVFRVVRLLRIHNRIGERLDKGILAFACRARHQFVNLSAIHLSKEALRILLALNRQSQSILGRSLKSHRSRQLIRVSHQNGFCKRHTGNQVHWHLGQARLGIPLGCNPIRLLSLILALIKNSAESDKRSRQCSRLTQLQRIFVGQVAPDVRKGIQ